MSGREDSAATSGGPGSDADCHQWANGPSRSRDVETHPTAIGASLACAQVSIAHCGSSRQIIAHSTNCNRDDCPVCESLKRIQDTQTIQEQVVELSSFVGPSPIGGPSSVGGSVQVPGGPHSVGDGMPPFNSPNNTHTAQHLLQDYQPSSNTSPFEAPNPPNLMTFKSFPFLPSHLKTQILGKLEVFETLQLLKVNRDLRLFVLFCKGFTFRNESILRCIVSLVHACECRDANCRRLSCHKMKRVVEHTKKRVNSTCPVCKQLIALCCYHAKHCSRDGCQVPFCMNIRQKLTEQERPKETHHNKIRCFEATETN